MTLGATVCLVGVCVLGPVELRSGQVIDAPVETMSEAGVTIGGAQTRVLAWDRVARITGERAQEALVYQGLAVDVWRARSRLARTDLALAAPLFEKLYREHDPEGPTGLLIAEGVMRCRLESDPRGATEAWLASLALRADGAKIDGEPIAEGFTDKVTGLVPALPPFFVEGAPVELPESDDERTAAYARLYACAMGAEMTDDERRSSDDPAVEFVRLIVLAQRGDGGERDAAREVLANQRRTSRDEGWRDAWRLGAIGFALSRSDDDDERLGGVFALLEVPARWGETQAHLSAVCLLGAARTLDDLGRTDEARRLRDELRATFPDHPASTTDDHPARQEPA